MNTPLGMLGTTGTQPLGLQLSMPMSSPLSVGASVSNVLPSSFNGALPQALNPQSSPFSSAAGLGAGAVAGAAQHNFPASAAANRPPASLGQVQAVYQNLTNLSMQVKWLITATFQRQSGGIHFRVEALEGNWVLLPNGHNSISLARLSDGCQVQVHFQDNFAVVTGGPEVIQHMLTFGRALDAQCVMQDFTLEYSALAEARCAVDTSSMPVGQGLFPSSDGSGDWILMPHFKVRFHPSGSISVGHGTISSLQDGQNACNMLRDALLWNVSAKPSIIKQLMYPAFTPGGAGEPNMAATAMANHGMMGASGPSANTDEIVAAAGLLMGGSAGAFGASVADPAQQLPQASRQIKAATQKTRPPSLSSRGAHEQFWHSTSQLGVADEGGVQEIMTSIATEDEEAVGEEALGMAMHRCDIEAFINGTFAAARNTEMLLIHITSPHAGIWAPSTVLVTDAKGPGEAGTLAGAFHVRARVFRGVIAQPEGLEGCKPVFAGAIRVFQSKCSIRINGRGALQPSFAAAVACVLNPELNADAAKYALQSAVQASKMANIHLPPALTLDVLALRDGLPSGVTKFHGGNHALIIDSGDGAISVHRACIQLPGLKAGQEQKRRDFLLDFIRKNPSVVRRTSGVGSEKGRHKSASAAATAAIVANQRTVDQEEAAARKAAIVINSGSDAAPDIEKAEAVSEAATTPPDSASLHEDPSPRWETAAAGKRKSVESDSQSTEFKKAKADSITIAPASPVT